LRLTVSQPVRLGIGTLDQILSCTSFSSDNYFIFRSKAPSLTRKRVCSLQCNHSLVRSLTPNHILQPHLRLCSFFVASYDSQGLRWRCSNPPPHGVHIGCVPYISFICDGLRRYAAIQPDTYLSCSAGRLPLGHVIRFLSTVQVLCSTCNL
jgi:hypothetical protein